MVQRIRIRGHVIRTLGVRPSSSRISPESCPSCLRFYNDGKYRRCVYLCCEFEDCLDCAIHQNKFYCQEIMEQTRSSVITSAVHQSTKDKMDTKEVSTALPEHSDSKLISPYIIPGDLPKIKFPQVKKPLRRKKYTKKKQSTPTQDIFKLTRRPCESSSILTVRVKQLIPQHHWLPVVCLDTYSVENYWKRQATSISSCTSKLSPNKGRFRKCRNA